MKHSCVRPMRPRNITQISNTQDVTCIHHDVHLLVEPKERWKQEMSINKIIIFRCARVQVTRGSVCLCGVSAGAISRGNRACICVYLYRHLQRLHIFGMKIEFFFCRRVFRIMERWQVDSQLITIDTSSGFVFSCSVSHTTTLSLEYHHRPL